MTELPNDDRFDRDLRRYLDWQAEQRAGAPSAVEASNAIAGRLERRSRVRAHDRLVWVIVLLGLLAALAIGSALVGSHPSLPIVQVAPSPSASPSEAPSASPSVVSNGWIAFPVEAAPGSRHGASAIDLVKDGVREHQVIGSAGVRDVCPSFSPDGARLAYSEAAARNGGQPAFTSAVVIVDINADGVPSGPTVRLRVPTEDEGDLCPVWAPDGQSVAFLTTVPGEPDLWIGRLDGTVTRVAAWDATGSASEIDWSPDGTSVVAVSGDESTLWVIPIDKRPAQVLRRADSGSQFADPKWSPDGTRIAVTVLSSDLSGVHSSIEMLASDGSGSPVQVAAAGIDPSTLGWSPDGQRLAFVRTTGPTGEDDIVIAGATLGGNAGSSSERVIASEAQGIKALLWSPDGTQLLYVHLAEESVSGVLSLSGALMSVPATGNSAAVRLTQQPRDFEDIGSSSISWQPVLP